MNETQQALLRAKIPCEESGIELKHTVCGMCCSAFYCGVDAYVKDGKILKVEGNPQHPVSQGFLCTKGQAGKEYVYSQRRIRTPLRRMGERGSGKFVPISWEEAFHTVAHELNKIKASHGPESVVFFSGVEKWYRFMLQRLAYSFGSPNYCSECSTCYGAMRMAWMLSAGALGRADLAHANCYLGFSLNPFYSRMPESPGFDAAKQRGMKIIIIDPRITPAVQQYADLHLQNLPGTDGALALGLGNLLIELGAVDMHFIQEHVWGFEEYRAYVKHFTPRRVEEITGVPAEKLALAARMIAENLPIAVHENFCALTHHVNGMQNYRAMLALSAITGSYDRVGGNVPRELTFSHMTAGFRTLEEEFIRQRYPQHARPPIGSGRFPLWFPIEGEAQAMDFARQALSGDPYPLHALVGFGMNYRMFPDDLQVLRALNQMDFVVQTDLFFTDTCRYADIVLPACTSYERSEFKCVRGGYALWTKPAIQPLYQSRPDSDILSGLANALGLDDALLCAGYEACMSYVLSNLGETVQQIKQADVPVKVPQAQPYQERAYTRQGYRTPTGKFELYSTVIAELPKEWGLDPLPTYRDSDVNAPREQFPFLLFSAPRKATWHHSRLQNIRSLELIQREPTADLASEDARKLGICPGDWIWIITECGKIHIKANLTETMLSGTVSVPNSIPEADINSIISADHVDPYSGFPGFRSVRCRIER